MNAQDRGRLIAWGIAAYLIVKSVLNLFLGHFALDNWISLGISIALAAVLVIGIRRANYAAAIVLALIALWYLPGNLGGLPGSWLYLIEGIVDIGAAAVLVAVPDVKAFFDGDNTSE